MNLEQSDSFKDEIEKNVRHRRGVMISIILCGVLLVFLIGMIFFINYQDSITEKFFLDGKQINAPKDLYKELEGKTYINLKEISSILGYTYTKGEYGKYNENEDSGYMQNDFEIVAVTAEASGYEKYLELTGKATIGQLDVSLKSDNGYCETFKVENPIKFIDGSLYAPLENVPEMFNVAIDWQQYRKKFVSFPSIVMDAQKTIGRLGYNQVSGYYENLRALLYGYAIVGNGADARAKQEYGVISLRDGKEIISIKYDDIKFAQNVREYYITVANGTMGILGEDGSTIISPSEYEDISLLDDENQLYLVKKDSEYGVLNRKGKAIIYAENDEIGFDTSDYTVEPVENEKLLFGKVIPVEKSGKYGLYNIEGDLVLPLNYDDLGYKSTASKSSGNEESTLLIPSSVGINGIVVNLNDFYGIFDVNREELILPCSYSKIYSITKSGKTTYYVDFNGIQMDLKELLRDNLLNNVDEEGNVITEKKNNKETENSINTNTVDNTINNSTIELN